MSKDLYCVVLFFGSIIFLIGFPIWTGIFFGIYFPLTNRDWEQTICKVTEIKTYNFRYIEWHTYIQYKLAVKIDDKHYPGYACESSRYNDRPDNYMPSNTYPYNYGSCDTESLGKGEVCTKDLVLLPRWLCSPLESTPAFSVGDVVKCKWWLNHPEGKTDPRGEKLSYPKEDKAFLEVMFKDKVYIPEHDYNALMVIPLGLMSVIPALLIIFCALPGVFGLYTKENFSKCKDCCLLYVIRKKGYIPKSKKFIPKLNANTLENCMAFLYAFDNLKDSKMKFKESIARKVVYYLK